jgi:diguanylate cyclase
LTQLDNSLISTVRVNGISAAAIGMGLALIVWRTTLMNINQKRIIEAQKEELIHKNRQLEKMARTDMMTGLRNRMSFTEETEKEMARSRRTGNTSSIVLFDLDKIKKVNDQYGHPAGDQVLKSVAELIRGQLREIDLAARFGGDEFALLLPDTDLQGAIKAAEKIRLAISEHHFTLLNKSLRITASFGVAVLNNNDKQSFNSLYQEADQALYRAKKEGRNRVEC